MARGGENQLGLDLISRCPYFKRWISGSGGWTGALFPRRFQRWWSPVSLNRQQSPFGPIYRLFIAINHLEWVPYSVHLLLEWCWLAMASQTWCVEAKVVWCSNLAFGRFGRFGRLCARCYARPSCPNYPGEASLVRPRTQSRGLLRQVPQSGRGLCRYKCSKLPISRFVQISAMSPPLAFVESCDPR